MKKTHQYKGCLIRQTPIGDRVWQGHSVRMLTHCPEGVIFERPLCLVTWYDTGSTAATRYAGWTADVTSGFNIRVFW